MSRLEEHPAHTCHELYSGWLCFIKTPRYRTFSLTLRSCVPDTPRIEFYKFIPRAEWREGRHPEYVIEKYMAEYWPDHDWHCYPEYEHEHPHKGERLYRIPALAIYTKDTQQ